MGIGHAAARRAVVPAAAPTARPRPGRQPRAQPGAGQYGGLRHLQLRGQGPVPALRQAAGRTEVATAERPYRARLPHWPPGSPRTARAAERGYHARCLLALSCCFPRGSEPLDMGCLPHVRPALEQRIRAVRASPDLAGAAPVGRAGPARARLHRRSPLLALRLELEQEPGRCPRPPSVRVLDRRFRGRRSDAARSAGTGGRVTAANPSPCYQRCITILNGGTNGSRRPK